MELRINLTDPTKGIIFSGQPLNGVVEISSSRDTLINYVVIELMGKERTEVQQISPTRSKSSTGVENELVRDVLYLWNDTSFPSGRMVFPFSFVVPQKLPPSFEGEFGFIRYLLRLRVIRPDPFVDQFVVKPLSIASIYDLKHIPYASYRTRRMLNEKRERLLRQGRLKVTVNINKSGFVCGEKIAISVDIDNMSPLKVMGIKGTIRQHTTYFSYDVYEESNRMKIAEHTYNVSEFYQKYEVDPKEKNIYRGKSPRLPPVSPSIRQKLIHVDYDVQFEISLDQGPSAFTSIPIVIGNIPCNCSTYSPTIAFYKLDRITPAEPSSVNSLMSENIIHVEQKCGKRSEIKDSLYNFTHCNLLPLVVYYDNL